MLRLSDRRALGSAALKLVFGLSCAGLAFAATYSSAPTEFPVTELKGVLLYGSTVHLVLSGAVLVLLRSRAQNAALALVVLASTASSYLIHTDLYLGGSRAGFWLASTTIGLGLFAVLEFMDSSPWLRGGVPATALVALAVAVASQTGSWAHEPAREELVRDYAALLNPIDFDSTPNLYFLAFDALSPQSVGQEHLGIETTDLIDLVNAEFRRFPNLFTDARWSRNVLNVLAYLDRDLYWSVHQREGPAGHLTGRLPVPLYDILHDNGYETSFVYASSHFGDFEGPYVDNLELGEASTACGRLDPSISAIAFWGYCNLPGARSSGWGDKFTEQFDQVERMIRGSAGSSPQFVLTYIRLPEHTERSFDYSDSLSRAAFREAYIRKSNLAAHGLAGIIETIEEADPTALLFVFGDHGPRLSRSLEFDDNPDFFVKDNYAVLGGIWPSDACEAWFDKTLAEPYLTLLDAVHTILRCLSGGTEALTEPGDRTLSSYGDIPDGSERSFVDFLYE